MRPRCLCVVQSSLASKHWCRRTAAPTAGRERSATASAGRRTTYPGGCVERRYCGRQCCGTPSLQECPTSSWRPRALRPWSLWSAWACFFTAERAVEGDFVGEYVGEPDSSTEAHARGRLYDAKGVIFLYAITKKVIIDTTCVGSHVKFANHSTKNASLKPKLLNVSGFIRVGLFAPRALDVGEELSFDYGYAVSGWDERRRSLCMHCHASCHDIVHISAEQLLDRKAPVEVFSHTVVPRL